MNIEEAYYLTEEKTKEILDCYKEFIRKRIADQSGTNNFTLEYELTPKYFDYDAIFYLNGKRVLNVEAKVRDNIALNYYQETKLPLRKYAVAYLYFNKFNTKTVYLCLFSDYLCTMYLHEDPDKIVSMIARHDRGSDKDEYAMYNVNRFNIIA